MKSFRTDILNRLFLTLFLVTFVCFAVLIPGVSALHDSDVSVVPEWRKASTSTDYTITVSNEDCESEACKIKQVEVTIPTPDYSSLSCTTSIPSGWTLQSSTSTTCTYVTSSTYIFKDNSKVFVLTATTASTSGEYTWDVTTADRSSGYDFSNPKTKVDADAPETIDDAPSEWQSEDVDVTLTCQDNVGGSGCHETKYCIDDDGTTCTPDITGTSVSIQCSEDSVCKKYVRYYSTDVAGNEESIETSAQIKIDKEKPETDLTSDPFAIDGENDWFMTAPEITLTCDDGSGSGCAVYYKWDEGSYQEYTDPLTAPEGTHTLYYYSVDNVGNTESPSSQEFKTDTQAPTPSIDPSPPSTISVYEGGLDVSCECEDDGGSGCSENKLYISTTTSITDCSEIDYGDYGSSTETLSSHSYVCAVAKDTAGNIEYSSPAEFWVYSSIQDAIDAASSMDTIDVAAGTYAETLNLGGKTLTIEGAGVGSTIIDASGLTGYAIQNFGDSSTVRDLTLIGTGSSSSSYGFKISHVSDITLENIKVEDSYKTGIDLNTVDEATLSDIEVTDTVSGFGLMILDSTDVTVTDITTTGNAWGGVSVQTKNDVSDSITFDGIFNVQEDLPILLEKDPPTYYDITNVDIPSKFNYVVYDFREGDEYEQWYYFETLNDAKTVAQAFAGSVSPVYSDIVIYDILEENYYVFEGMLIQDAIDAAESTTINVAAGTYEEDLVITTDNLELVGEDKTTTTIKGIANVHKSNWPLGDPNIDIQADGVVIHRFTIEGPNYVADYYASGIILDGKDIEIYDNDFVTTKADTIDELAHAVTTISKAVVTAADVSGLYIHDNTITCSGTYGCEAIYINPHTGTGTITIDTNEFSGSIYVGITAESGNIAVTGNTIDTAISGLYGVRFMDTTYAATYDNIVVSGNNIQNFEKGIRVGNGEDGDSVFVASILSNTLSNNDIGIWTRKGSQVTTTYNLISGNTVGIQNDIATVVNAETNWWGYPTGPYHATDNPLGEGDDVSDNVDFYPWAYNTDMYFDTTDPTSTINSPNASSWQNTDFQVDISDFDTGGSELYYCQYRVLSNSVETKEWTDRECDDLTPSLLVGSGLECKDQGTDMCQIEVNATDKGGNTGSTETMTFSIDWTAPTATITINSDYEYADTTSVTLDLTYSDSVSDVDQCRYSNDAVWDTEAWETYAASKSWTLTSGDGTKTVYYQVKDSAGNIGEDSDTIILDTQPPEISGVTGNTYVKVGFAKTISATITDDASGVASATLHFTDVNGVSDEVVMNEIAENIWSAEIPEQSDDGTVTYYIIAKDNVDNEARDPEEPNTYTVTVYDFVLSLEVGWNQISVPKEPDAESVSRLKSLVDIVYEYDATLPPPEAWIEDPDSIEPGIGYFIDSYSEQEVGINYKPGAADPNAPSPFVDLVSGWNLIGHMCTASSNISHVFNTQIAQDRLSQMLWYDTTSGYQFYLPGIREDFDTMEAGKGYWILLVMPTGEGSIPYTNTCSV